MSFHYPRELLSLIRNVTAKRPRTVLQHILDHGYVTTEELAQSYGYNHPPRAARDVREAGIPLKTERIRGRSGRIIARYSLDVDEFKRRTAGRPLGRRVLPAGLKRDLISISGNRCEICLTVFENELDLQVDHRLPYEIGGDPPFDETTAFMLLCPSCNREKSWRCEHCPNWERKAIEVCRQCFWANPSNYAHVAMTRRRAVVVAFSDEEETLYQLLEDEGQRKGLTFEEIIKDKLKSARH